ncbi:hypothetical protein KC220_28320, partial [Mycobacterium tuberculosis]|nr:hypothetical protein [Mycobacterium tuberculosis]
AHGKGVGILQSTARLSMLSDNVLDLTQGEGGTLPIEHARVDLAKVVQDSASRMTMDAIAKGIEIEIALKESLGAVQG